MGPEQVAITVAADHGHRASVDRSSSIQKKKPSVVMSWLRSIPSYVYVAFAVLAVLETLAMVGCYYYIAGQANSSRDAALNIARGARTLHATSSWC